MNYNSVLSIKHFSDSGFCLLMRHLFVHHAASDPFWPRGNELSRAWELTAAARAMRDLGYMDHGKRALVVGGGMDLLTYLLTDYLHEVVVTKKPEEEPLSIRRWHRDRMRILSAEEKPAAKSFDIILVAEDISQRSSIASSAQRIAEISEFLKSDGVLIVVIEVLDRTSVSNSLLGKVFFSPDEIVSHIVLPSGLVPVDQPDLEIDEATRKTAYSFEEAAGSGLRPTSVMLFTEDMSWTSACLVLASGLPNRLG
jgi:hypothetical protein